MFFSNPLTEGIFRGSKSELSLKRAILERSAISRGAENGPIFSNNILKNGKKGISPNSLSTLEPTWARFGAGNAQLSFFHRSGVVFGRFLMDFTSFLIDFSCYVRYICWLFREGFGMNFARALKKTIHILVMISIRISRFKFLILFSQNANPHIPYSISCKSAYTLFYFFKACCQLCNGHLKVCQNDF